MAANIAATTLVRSGPASAPDYLPAGSVPASALHRPVALTKRIVKWKNQLQFFETLFYPQPAVPHVVYRFNF